MAEEGGLTAPSWRPSAEPASCPSMSESRPSLPGSQVAMMRAQEKKMPPLAAGKGQAGDSVGTEPPQGALCWGPEAGEGADEMCPQLRGCSSGMPWKTGDEEDRWLFLLLFSKYFSSHDTADLN